MLTPAQTKAARSYVLSCVRKEWDWQRIVFETIERFDWLTGSDQDQEFVEDLVSWAEDRVADEESIAYSDPRNQGLSILS